MFISKTFYFLFFITFVISTPLTQTQAQNFIQINGLVPSNANLQSFTINPNEETAIVTYKHDNTNFKFILTKDQQGKTNLLFKQQILSIGFPTIPQTGHVQIMPAINLQTIPLPVPVQISKPFEAVFGQPFFEGRTNQMGHSKPGHFNFQNNKKKACKLNEELIKAQLKENLEIFKDAEIKEIRKVGFEFGTGILLEIDLRNGNKDFTIHAGYLPRKNKLHVVRIIEVKAEKEKMNPLETGKKLLNKVMKDMKTPFQSVEYAGLKFENIIQSFVEKLLIRKNLKLGENQEFEQQHLLIGSEGEQQMSVPLILGSEDQKERIEELFSSVSSSSESSSSSSSSAESESESESQTQSSAQSSSATTSISEQEEERNVVLEELSQKSEEISFVSELANEMFDKLKLKIK